MKTYTRIGGIMGLLAAGLVAWALFRPELLWINSRVDERAPEAVLPASATGAAAAGVLATGHFHGVAHKTAGSAAIHRLSDGRRILRFTDFETSNGPDVHVYLVAADDALDRALQRELRHRAPHVHAWGDVIHHPHPEREPVMKALLSFVVSVALAAGGLVSARPAGAGTGSYAYTLNNDSAQNAVVVLGAQR
jgi:hypothetical protein